MYLSAEFKVGVIVLNNFTVVILLNIEGSALLIASVNLECLKTPVKFNKLSWLYSMIALLIFVLKVETSFVVLSESYLKSVDKRMKVVSGSIISCLTEATANCFRLWTILFFVATVKLDPDFALIDIKTFPYAGVSASSPP